MPDNNKYCWPNAAEPKVIITVNREECRKCSPEEIKRRKAAFSRAAYDLYDNVLAKRKLAQERA